MCLARSAHGVVPNHPIFQSPFPVHLEYTEVPTPENYRQYIDGTDLPETMRVWNVDEVDYTSATGMQPGTVSDGWGFADSPDAEVIAGGINHKGPSAVALGRHGSLFLWGFAAEPARMTPSGRNAFLNAIHYIQGFDHAPRLVDRVERDRRWAVQYASQDPAKAAAMRADLEYLIPNERAFVVDEDCKALGLSNRDTAILERCVSLLEKGEDVERAGRILARYTAREHATPAAWRAWLDDARPHLFFSDVGGFRFFDPRSPEPTAPKTPTNERPVAASLSVLPAAAAPGDVIAVTITVAHAPGWHTYASLAPNSPYIETSIALDLPDDWVTVGRWERPVGVPYADEAGTQVAEGTVHYVRRVRVGKSPAATLRANVSFLACDATRCLPPDELKVEAVVTAKPQ